MYKVYIKESNHVWVKKNLVTISRGGRMYDEVVCENCGMKGKRYNFPQIEISDNYKRDNVENCPKAPALDIPKKIKVIFCQAQGKAFMNIIPGSIHDVIDPQNGYKNDHKGVWVMGCGEPVKLLNDEFTIVKEEIVKMVRTKFRK